MKIPIYNDSRDHAYAQLIRILFSSGNKPLCAKNEHDLWQLLHDVVMFSENEYKFFIDTLKKMREVVDSGQLIYRQLLCDNDTLARLSYEKHAKEIEELRKRKISPPFKKPYVNLIVDLGCLPEDSCQHFLVLMESLRVVKVHPVLANFNPHLP